MYVGADTKAAWDTGSRARYASEVLMALQAQRACLCVSGMGLIVFQLAVVSTLCRPSCRTTVVSFRSSLRTIRRV